MEWERKATFGSAPTRVLNVFAVSLAIAAKLSLSGSWFRPQSANANVPL